MASYGLAQQEFLQEGFLFLQEVFLWNLEWPYSLACQRLGSGFLTGGILDRIQVISLFLLLRTLFAPRHSRPSVSASPGFSLAPGCIYLALPGGFC